MLYAGDRTLAACGGPPKNLQRSRSLPTKLAERGGQKPEMTRFESFDQAGRSLDPLDHALRGTVISPARE